MARAEGRLARAIAGSLTTWYMSLLCDGGDGRPHSIGGVEPITVRVPTAFLVAAAPYLRVVGLLVKVALKLALGVTVPGVIDAVGQPGGGLDLVSMWDASSYAVEDAAGEEGSKAVANVAGFADNEGVHAAIVCSVSDRALDELKPILDAHAAEVRRFGLGHAVLEGRGHVWLCGACAAMRAADIARARTYSVGVGGQ